MSHFYEACRVATGGHYKAIYGLKSNRIRHRKQVAAEQRRVESHFSQRPTSGESEKELEGLEREWYCSSDSPETVVTGNRSTSEDTPAGFKAWFTISTMLQLWAVLLGFGYAGVPLLAQILDSVVGGAEAEQGGGLAQAGALFTMELVVVLAVRGLLRRRGASEEGSVLVPRLQWRWSLRDAAIGVSAGAGALAVNSAMLALTGQVGSQAEATGEVAAILQQRDVLPALLLYCGSALLAPAAEELAYRGFLLPSLQRVLPTPAAVFAVALLFAAAHLQLDGLVQLTVVGVLLGAAAAATGGNLAAPTLGHMVYNSALFLDLLGAGAHGGGGATGTM